MKTMRAAAAAAVAGGLLVGALAGCGLVGGSGSGGPTTAPTTSSATGAPGAGGPAGGPSTPAPGPGAEGPEELAVEAALRQYQQSLVVREFGTACALTTDETAARLVSTMAAAGAQIAGGPVRDCPGALAALFSQPGAIEAATESADSTTVQDVVIDGLNATIRWTSQVQGRARTDSVAMQFGNGQWRLVGTAAR